MRGRTPNLRHLWRWPPDPERYAVPVDEDGEPSLPEDPSRLRAGNNPWGFVYVADHPDGGWIVDAPKYDEAEMPGAMIERGPGRYRDLPEALKRRCYRCRVARREDGGLLSELTGGRDPTISRRRTGRLSEMEYRGPDLDVRDEARRMAADEDEPDVREHRVALEHVQEEDVVLDEPREPHGFAGEPAGRQRRAR